uniref:Putative ovule protein n=1 Tax=Solanum chacoense TaxID=4108 RepID=A0A0V0IX23_SOLCH
MPEFSMNSYLILVHLERATKAQTLPLESVNLLRIDEQVPKSKIRSRRELRRLGPLFTQEKFVFCYLLGLSSFNLIIILLVFRTGEKKKLGIRPKEMSYIY